jgi:hypothetical protein
MLSCRASTGNVGGGGNGFMARLLDGSESIRRSLPETAVFKQSMKLHQTAHRNAGFAHLHVGARRPIQHPRRNLNDLAGLDLHSDNCATGTILAAFMPKTHAEIWMPTIMKFYHLPDMGRMNL